MKFAIIKLKRIKMSRIPDYLDHRLNFDDRSYDAELYYQTRKHLEGKYDSNTISDANVFEGENEISNRVEQIATSCFSGISHFFGSIFHSFCNLFSDHVEADYLIDED